MKKEIVIKGKNVGSPKPLICVPIMEHTKEDIINEAIRLESIDTQMIEWRVDAFDEGLDLNAIKEVLDELALIIKNAIFVYTFRSKKEGGLLLADEKLLQKIHMLGAEAKVVDFVDVEVFSVEDVKARVENIKKRDSYVIGSCHNFSKTPSDEEIRYILETINDVSCDVVKLAVMPENTQDVLRLLKQTALFHEQHKDVPLVTMSMGTIGSISRVSGEYFGSCITFGAGKASSAPGQLESSKLQAVLDVLHGACIG